MSVGTTAVQLHVDCSLYLFFLFIFVLAERLELFAVIRINRLQGILTAGWWESQPKPRKRTARDVEKSPTILVVNYALMFLTSQELPANYRGQQLRREGSSVLFCWQRISSCVHLLQLCLIRLCIFFSFFPQVAKRVDLIYLQWQAICAAYP